MDRRDALLVLITHVAGAAVPSVVMGQSNSPFPSRPIRILVGFQPGGATDTAARLIADHMAKLAGQPVIVENRPGAGGIVAATAVAKAPPDGHVMLLNTAYPVVQAQGLFRSLPYDPVRELAPVTPILAASVLFVVARSVPATNLKEFVEYARRSPNVAIGSWAPGSQGHLGVEAINKRFGLNIPHVPYKGEGPMTQDIIGGQLPAGFGSFFSMIGAVKSGHIRVVAVTNGPRGNRMPLLPDIRTFAEQGLDSPAVTLSGWIGIVTTGGTPRPVVAKLNEWIRASLARADIRSKLEAYGMEVVSSTPEEFEASIRAETPLWVKAINDVGVKLD